MSTTKMKMNMSMTIDRLTELLGRIKYDNCSFRILELERGLFIQVISMGPCADTGKITLQHGRKWYISSHATTSEVVQTAFKAVLTFAEHEVRENFKYRGKAVFGPHYDVDALWEISNCKDVRNG